MAVFRYKDKEFDSANVELTFGDMETLEAQGIELSKMGAEGKAPLTQTLKVALFCMQKLDPSVDMEFARSIPMAKVQELTAFVQDFFERSLSGAGDKSS